MELLDNAIVSLNNLAVKTLRTKVRPDELLLLFSSCLQFSQCEQRVATDLTRCKRCGRCPVKDLLDLADEFGVRPALATGGHQALVLVKDPAIKAIVAVACEKELREGLLGCFPKPVFAVPITKPNGPCRDTCADPPAVRRALEWILRE